MPCNRRAVISVMSPLGAVTIAVPAMMMPVAVTMPVPVTSMCPYRAGKQECRSDERGFE